MAEVTGYLGDQPIELNNAATEETMKQLVAAIALMSTKMGADKKSQAHQAKELDKFFKQLGTTTDKMKKLNDQVDDAVTLEKKANAARESQIAGLKKLTGGLESAVGKLANIMNSFASMGSSISGAVSAMSTVNKNLGVVFAGVATSTERLMTVFQQTASVGANFNGSIREMANTISGTGMTFEQFSSVISKNSQSLALFGGSTQEGAKRIAQMSKTLKNDIPKLSDDLARLGFSTTDIADNMAWYGSLMQRTGNAQNMSNKQLIQTSAEYMKNLDMISRITGQSKQDLMAKREAERTDAAFRMLEQKSGGNAENVRMLLDLLPPEFREAGKTLMARKAPVTAESQALMQQFPDLAQKMINLGVQIDTTGQMSREDALNTYRLGLEESAYRGNQQRAFNEATQYQDKYNNAIVGTIEFQQRAKDGVERAMQEQLNTLAQQRKTGMDAAKNQELQQDIANKSNEATVTQAEQIDKLITAYKTISDQLPVVTSLYQQMMNNIGLVIVGLAAFNAALWAASNLPGGRGGMGGPGGGKGSKGGPGGGKGSWGKNLGKVGKFSAGGILAGLVLDQAANMATSSGHENLGAGLDIGSSALGWAGTGALLGSIFPGVGTLIGGAIGGAIGTGLGIWNNWGTITKKETAVKKDSVKKQEEFNNQLEEITRKRKNAEQAIDLNDPIALLLNEIKTVAPRVFEAFLRGNANGGVSPGATGPTAPASHSGMATIKTASGKTAEVDARLAPRFQGLINDLESQGYRINDLGGFADRNIAGTNKKSQHSHGAAIDINPASNPMLKDRLVTDMPANIAGLAKKHGLGWGGNWKSSKDPMHFSAATNEGGMGYDWAPTYRPDAPSPANPIPSKVNPIGPNWTRRSANPNVGKPELDKLASDRTQKTEMEKMLEKSKKGYNQQYTAQDAAQKAAESNATSLNTNDINTLVYLQREHNTLLKEQNATLKKGGWMVGKPN